MVTSPSRPEHTVTTDALIEHQHLESCRNCGTVTQGNFCQQCGQATHLHVPSAREFLHEFIAHYVALEGKLWHSLKLLIFKPGLLTREYIEGRRIRYVEPLRLYLSFSIIFFFVIKMSGVGMMGGHERTPRAEKAAKARVEQTAQTEQTPVAAPPQEEKEKVKRGTDELKDIEDISPALAKRVERIASMPREQQEELLKRTFFSYAPYAIFLMMPVFALYLKLLYLGSGRRYGEHFLFALHSNAFAFLMLSLFAVAHNWGFVRFVVLVWLTFYLPTALRRVYGGSRKVTALRWMVLMFLHMVTMGLAMVGAVAMILL